MDRSVTKRKESKEEIEKRLGMSKLFAQDTVYNGDFGYAGLIYLNIANDLRKLDRFKEAKAYFKLSGINYLKAAEVEYKTDVQYSLLHSNSDKFKQLHGLYSKASESFKKAGMPSEWANCEAQAKKFLRLYESEKRHGLVPA